MPESSDAEIIADSVEQPHVFTALFDRHARGIHRFIARRIGAVDAHDVVSQTFLVAFENRERYDAAFPSARPWLFGIASNVMRHHCRSEVRAWRAMAASGIEVEPSFVDEVVDRVDFRAHGAAMAAVLADLHERDRDVLLLFAWEDFSYAEIAAALAIPVGTVRSRLHRARSQLQAALGTHVLEEINL
ncbi:RNA polymerase sigma factor [Aeromicrobium panaciterrae]|uniref:RNA polymerase sigma factor n=1 Tax=Aeromicrobium panaciterrae TaxID=363861 RepID=UPI0031D0D246